MGYLEETFNMIYELFCFVSYKPLLHITDLLIIDFLSTFCCLVSDQLSNVFYHHGMFLQVSGSKQSQTLQDKR